MKTSIYSRFMIVIVAIILCFALALPCMAQRQVIAAQTVGAGGLTVKGGTVKIQTVAGVDKVTIAPDTGNTAIAGTLAVTGASTIPIIPVVAETTATRTVTSADFGKIIACSYGGAITITLPDPAAGIVGATVFIANLVDQTLTIVGGAAANNNAIIVDGILTSDSVAFSTAGHKVGAMARCTCISATKWLITNASACAMTPEAAD